jgi:hypothetical protein
MKTLWFKSQFVDPILRGDKIDTIRPIDRRRFVVGERIGLTVGARPPFAVAIITSIEEVDAASIEIARLASVKVLIGAAARYRKIGFELVSAGDEDREGDQNAGTAPTVSSQNDAKAVGARQPIGVGER